MVMPYGHEAGKRTAAKTLLAALSLLLLVSFLALPCLHAGGDMFVSVERMSGMMSRPALRANRMASAPPMSPRPLLTPAPGILASVPTRPILQSIAEPSLSASVYAAVRSTPAQTATVHASIPESTSNAGSSAAKNGESCSDHKLFKPHTNVHRVFEGLALPDVLRHFLVVLVVLAFLRLRHETLRPLERPKPGWVRLRFLPFGATDPPRLAYFAAQRDA